MQSETKQWTKSQAYTLDILFFGAKCPLYVTLKVGNNSDHFPGAVEHGGGE